MKLTVTEVSIHKEDESPIFGKSTTIVKLEDEGAGTFIKITQYNGNDVDVLRLDFEEIEPIMKAIEMLKEGADV